MRHVAVDDLLREAFDDRGLADARLSDEDGVVLGPAAEDLLNALELDHSADERIQGVLHRRFGQVPRELGQQRRLLDARQRGLFVEERHDVLADGVQAHPFFHQDGRGDGTLLAQDSEQQMFSPDVVVQQPIGFFGRELQDPLRLRAERDFDRGRHLLAEDRPAFDFLADRFQRQVRARDDPAREALAFAHQT